MKKVLLFILVFITGCSKIAMEHPIESPFKIVGSTLSDNTWIYLCGLVTDFIPEHMEELTILDSIGKQLNIRFLVVIPTHRCAQLGNRLCWPQNNRQELLETYQQITQTIPLEHIKGWIGFSNGGFFLNTIAQLIALEKPIISIGGAGQLYTKKGPLNTLYLLIGKKDQWHYDPALNFYRESKDTNLKIHLIEYQQGHILPEDYVKTLLKMLSK